MGIGFVILIHLIGIFILCAIIAFISSIIAYFISRKERRKRKIFFIIISPFIGLYTMYIVALLGSIVLSEYKHIDIGIGDAWYVPLSNNCQLLFIDVPELGSIEHENQTVISEVSHIQQIGNQIYRKAYQGKYFSYNITDNKLREFPNEIDFKNAIANDKVVLKTAIDFYYKRRNDIAVIPQIIIGLVSLLASISLVYLARKIILK